MSEFDAKEFRRVLGHWATGVAVVTSMDGDEPIGLAVTSFTSVSLDPPLVLFCADKGSSTWPRIRAAGHYAVNLLAASQQEVCNAFATRGADRFGSIDWSTSDLGSPLIGGVVGWIDCRLVDVVKQGDHYLAIGEVGAMHADDTVAPLLYFQSAYREVTATG